MYARGQCAAGEKHVRHNSKSNKFNLCIHSPIIHFVVVYAVSASAHNNILVDCDGIGHCRRMCVCVHCCVARRVSIRRLSQRSNKHPKKNRQKKNFESPGQRRIQAECGHTVYLLPTNLNTHKYEENMVWKKSDGKNVKLNFVNKIYDGVECSDQHRCRAICARSRKMRRHSIKCCVLWIALFYILQSYLCGECEWLVGPCCLRAMASTQLRAHTPMDTICPKRHRSQLLMLAMQHKSLGHWLALARACVCV